MAGLKRLTKIDEISERYANEFEQYGLEHVKIIYEDQVKD